MNNLINLKYEIGLMSNMVRLNYTNIEALMNISNKNLNSTTPSYDDKFNIDQILPVKSESELKALEDNLKIDDFKTSLVLLNHFSIKQFFNIKFFYNTNWFYRLPNYQF